jgi:uncharacterized protein YqfA (UPF0365 family)
MSYSHFDATSTEGIILSVAFIVLAKIFLFIDAIAFLQGVSYFVAITIGIDTLFGAPLRTYLTRKFKEFTKSKKK